MAEGFLCIWIAREIARANQAFSATAVAVTRLVLVAARLGRTNSIGGRTKILRARANLVRANVSSAAGAGSAGIARRRAEAAIVVDPGDDRARPISAVAAGVAMIAEDEGFFCESNVRETQRAPCE